MEDQNATVILSTLSEEEFMDEIHLYVIPELIKNGKMKGWSSSVKLEIHWKGNIISRSTHHNLQEAVMRLPGIFHDLCSAKLEDTMPDFGDMLAGTCFQPGCSEPASAIYTFLDKSDDPEDTDERIRYFCSEHADRGNCFDEDCNEAYEVIEEEESKVVPLTKRTLPKVEKLCSVKEDAPEEPKPQPTKEETES
jgi:hypothetical protein